VPYLCFMRSFYFLLCLLLLAASCKDDDRSSATSEGHLDAARNFIRAALDGKFDEARNFMLRDSVNLNYMDVVERAYKNLDQATRDNYRTSSIRILEKKNLDDSTSVVVYSNSFKNDPDTLKVLRLNQQWLVDLKYLYEHDEDTLIRPVHKDSLP